MDLAKFWWKRLKKDWKLFSHNVAGKVTRICLFEFPRVKDSREGGPCRSKFSAQIFTTKPHWLRGVTSQKFLEIGPAVLEIWLFLDCGHKMWTKLVLYEEISIFIRISWLFRRIIWHVKANFWFYFWSIWANTRCTIKYRGPQIGLSKKCKCIPLDLEIMHKLLQKKSCLFSADSIDKLGRYGELKIQNFEKLVLFTIIPNWYVLEQYGTSDGPLFCPICGRGSLKFFSVQCTGLEISLKDYFKYFIKSKKISK